MCAFREKAMKGCSKKPLEAKERGLSSSQSCLHLGLGFSASRTRRKLISAI
jgi:hypothetical protein